MLHTWKWTMPTRFGWQRDHLEDSDVDGTILKWILNETVCKGVGWIHLARDKDQANTLMNLSFPRNGNFITSSGPIY